MKILNTQQKLNKCSFPAASITNKDSGWQGKEALPKVILRVSDSPACKPGFWPRGSRSRWREEARQRLIHRTGLARGRENEDRQGRSKGRGGHSSHLTNNPSPGAHQAWHSPAWGAGLPGGLWRYLWDPSILAHDLRSRHPSHCSPRQGTESNLPQILPEVI